MTAESIALIDAPYTYSLLCDRLRHALDIKEAAQWLIGDILNQTQTVYAERTIAGLAADIGVSPSSLYSWRDVAAFYPVEDGYREDYHAKGLYYSHLRLAMSLGSIDEACTFLDMAALNRWSVNQSALELRRAKGAYVPPMPVFSGTLTFRVERGYCIVDGLQGIVMKEGVSYKVIIKEV